MTKIQRFCKIFKVIEISIIKNDTHDIKKTSKKCKMGKFAIFCSLKKDACQRTLVLF